MLDHAKNARAKVNFASAFPKAILAVIDGEQVRLTHIGDVEGMSPAYNVVDAQGRSSWQPQSKVQILDTDYLPYSPEGLTGQSASGSASGSRAGQATFPQASRT